ncbi:hypothetical protein AWB69_03733 [Caballeronia udeis]|uniref:Uncharacterized protein n=1 Tax=Caballeronia udeis TaxID=1232866 RepID=A0A158H1F0_9BURK|nr:hypothetical protein AWB69_03733 [Caballeronia udeis]
MFMAVNPKIMGKFAISIRLRVVGWLAPVPMIPRLKSRNANSPAMGLGGSAACDEI